ncbi:hypothetical protein TSUD_62850 [Trifolium subterraneum]|uniref:Protein TIFY n=1 Tax=Trifolium subterraneum TaxID=3900 RepID=A0A2Z6NKU6_TRISU|nr:hypothetical protein TSUD_62850 [Trifolium subterraneum]
MNGANVKQPLLTCYKTSFVHPIVGTVAGLTEPCVKPSASSSQLTMFYSGTVKIFNDIAPEKAQAIMLLAGNGISAASNMVQHEVQAPSSKFASGDDGVPMSPLVNRPPSSGISSPLSVSSHTGPQLGSGSCSSDEFLAAKTSRGPTPTTSASKVETPKVVSYTSGPQSIIDSIFGEPQGEGDRLQHHITSTTRSPRMLQCQIQWLQRSNDNSK